MYETRSAGTVIKEDMMSTTATYAVTGMTCAHCVAAVTEEFGLLDEVSTVDVDLNAGGTSLVTVTSAEPLPMEAVRAAVDEAGYTLIA
jgi:copper chaperone CopZ